LQPLLAPGKLYEHPNVALLGRIHMFKELPVLCIKAGLVTLSSFDAALTDFIIEALCKQ